MKTDEEAKIKKETKGKNTKGRMKEESPLHPPTPPERNEEPEP